MAIHLIIAYKKGVVIVKKAIAGLCIALLCFGLWWSEDVHAGQKEMPLISIQVVSPDGNPVENAFVSLWDHSRTPTQLVGEGRADKTGIVQFSTPEFFDEEDNLSQHLSVMISAPGYDITSWHWYEDSVEDTGRLMKAESKGITVALKELDVSQLEGSEAVTSTQGGITPLQYVGEIRHRLEWWDYNTYTNKPTTVAYINQVGWLDSKFTFKTKVETVHDVGVTSGFGGWTISGTNKVTKGIETSLTWRIEPPEEPDNTIFRQEKCVTGYDYRLEQYAVEQFQDDGDIQQWVRIGTSYKFLDRKSVV